MQTHASIVVWAGLSLAALGCEQSVEEKAMETAQQGQMVSMGPGGQAGQALAKVAPFPGRSAFQEQLRPPEVDPAATPGEPQTLRWDFAQKSVRIYSYDHHADFSMRMLSDGMKSTGDTQTRVRLTAAGDGQAVVRMEEGIIKARVQKPGSPAESGTDGFGAKDLGRMGPDAKWIGDVQAQGPLVALMLAVPDGPVTPGKGQHIPVQLPLDAGGKQTMVTGEAELTPVGFLTAGGHRCVLLRIAADVEHEKKQRFELIHEAQVRMAIKAEGWALFDTVDNTVRRAELAIYLGVRNTIPVTPHMRSEMCKKVSKRIPDEITMQADADNFIRIELQPAGK